MHDNQIFIDLLRSFHYPFLMYIHSLFDTQQVYLNMSNSIQYNETGINVSADIMRVIEKYDIPVNWVFGSFGLYAKRVNVAMFLAYYELFRQIVDVPGSIVECGVFQGNSLMSFAKFLEIFCPGDRLRKVIGFDTFKGFASTHEHDHASIFAEHAKKGGWSSEKFKPALDELIEIFHKEQFVPHNPRVELIEGDISKTLPEYVNQHPGLRISLLHIDVDLFEPSYVALQYLYPKVVSGGIVVLDDYAMSIWPGGSQAVEQYFGDKVPKFKKFPWVRAPGAYFIKE